MRIIENFEESHIIQMTNGKNNSAQCFVFPSATLIHDNLMKTRIHNISLNVDNSEIICGIMN